MNKRDLRLLERIFENDVRNALEELPPVPAQIRGKRIEELERRGYVRRAEIVLGGRFAVRVCGWELTALGHLTYCTSC